MCARSHSAFPRALSDARCAFGQPLNDPGAHVATADRAVSPWQALPSFITLLLLDVVGVYLLRCQGRGSKEVHRVRIGACTPDPTVSDRERPAMPDMRRSDPCAVKGCREPAYLTYSAGPRRNVPVCLKHWAWHCDDRRRFTLKDRGVYR